MGSAAPSSYSYRRTAMPVKAQSKKNFPRLRAHRFVPKIDAFVIATLIASDYIWRAALRGAGIRRSHRHREIAVARGPSACASALQKS